MTPFDIILQDLRELQTELKSTGDSLWHLKLARKQAHQKGNAENDFLPRRLTCIQNEAQSQFEHLLIKLRHITDKNLNPQFFIFNSSTEVKTFLKIKQTLRYLQNAYMDCSLRETLSRLNNILIP